MQSFSDYIAEASLNLTPEQKKRRAALKQKRKEWLAKGKDVSEIDKELAEIEGGAPAGPAPTSNGTGPTKRPAGTGKDWDEGYKAAIEAIKKAMKNKGKSQGGGAGAGSDDGLEGIPVDPDDQEGDQQSGSGSGGSGNQNQQGKSQGSGSGGSSGRSRNGKQSGQGVVRPEDCAQPSGGELDKTPGAAGGMISRQTGDKIAKSEGYDADGGNEDSVAKEWQERALRAASQMQGKGEGYEKLKARLDGLYKTTKDWKKELKKIVGQCISPDDKRSAYANKNILISQDRIARTDKDKYDNMSYMVAAIDTSGSMTQKYLEQCLNEIYQVALAKKPIRLVIMQFDTRVADVQEFTSLAQLKKDMHNYTIKGGGGTDVKPVFDMLLKDKKYSRIPTELLMIFTDGYLDQYKRNPRTMKNLVWVVVDNTGFDLKYKDMQTKCVRIKSEDFGK
jgi:hypothetical protein